MNEMSRATFITPEDIFNTIVRMGLLGRQNKDKFLLSKPAVGVWMDQTKANITSPCEPEAFEFSEGSASGSEGNEEDGGDDDSEAEDQ